METKKIVMSVTDLVKAVAQETDMTQKKVREIVDVIGAVAMAQLKEASSDTAVEVKLFPGVSLVSSLVAPRQARNPMTGEIFTTAEKVRVRGKIYGAFTKAINAGENA